VLAVGYAIPMIYFAWSLRYGKVAGANPWGATGLEWKTASPPPLHNFEQTPVVTHDAYDYSTVVGRRSKLASALQVQFDTEAQQKDASTLGMWIFLITEVMFFGGMFTAYTVYRRAYSDAFAVASSSLNVTIGAINTAVLLVSSFTMVMAVRAAQLGQRRTLVLFLVLTLIFGGIFLGVKAYEWNEKFEQHHVPGPSFHFDGVPQQGHAQLFFSLYFAMTGLHAAHMVIGLASSHG